MPEVGQIFDGKYRCVECIGAGGMGVVFKAEQLGLNRVVAIKMPKMSGANANSLRRFQQEAQALAKLDHRNLVKVYELGASTYGQPYTTMEFIEGKGLDSLIKEQGRLGLNQAINIFRQICDGLQYVHAQGILHRDLKPSNIMLINPQDENPTVKLVDFGIAKFIDGATEHNLTQTGEVFGSPLYMSPEQAKSLAVDERSDIYSLGCVMYESLTGIKLFSGQTIVELVMKHLREKPRPLNSVVRGVKYPNALEAIVHRTLEKEPAQRYQSIEEVAADLKTFAEENRAWYHIVVPDFGLSKQPAWVFPACLLVILGIVGVAVNFIVQQSAKHEKVVHVSLQDKKTPLLNEEDGMMSMDLIDDESVRNMIVREGREEELNLRKYIQPNNYHFLKERKDNYITFLRADSHGINDDAIPYFRDYPLVKVDLSSARITSASIPAISRMHTIESLNLSCVKLKSDDLRLLAKLDRLTEFFGVSSNLDDEAMKSVAKWSRLKNLIIGYNRISDDAAETLAAARLPLLRLSVARTLITDKGVEALSTLPIQDLDVSADQITDRCLPYLAKMKGLRVLGIVDDDEITDKGLASFNPVGLLKLRLGSLNQLTSKAIADFQKRTGCLVTRDG